ncbi:MAG: 1-acyl-sn-glycerol-3-phosphate acyltransferase [Acidobacteriota bacterium]|nr:1-acyl-sn-glycerol-3-phosphate acyltransferase [Acidobacteriota bacterium]
MPSFRRQTTTEPPLKERVRDVAVEAARESQQRVIDAAREVAQQAPERAEQLRAAVAQLDVRWARSAPAQWVRERFMQFVMNPILDHYAARRASGFERLAALKEPVILVANHASHMDTPVILAALPRRLRKRTAVAAAADYFYRNRITAWLASLLFNTVPVDRKGGGGGTKGASHLDKLLDDGWNLLLYPEGTRSRGNGLGKVRRGAAVLAARHNLSIVPIRVTGTAAAMPPGAVWPKRLRGRLFSRRHRVEVAFGEPIPPHADTEALIERVQRFFESGEGGPPYLSPYRRRGAGPGAAGDDAD